MTFREQAHQLRKQGLTLNQTAEKLGVTRVYLEGVLYRKPPTGLGWVESSRVFHFIDKSFPDMPTIELARQINRDERRLRTMRKQRSMSFESADDILAPLGLGFLLSTGDIPVYESQMELRRAAPSDN